MIPDAVDGRHRGTELELLRDGDASEAFLAALQRTPTGGVWHVAVLLDVAQGRAQAGTPGSEHLATQAARLLRRGCTYVRLYIPEGLVRCARLLHHSDPREAAALVHVARRWVHNALQQLPPGTEDGFRQHGLAPVRRSP